MKLGFTISEFAALRNININSLRYYEKIGVLIPAYKDPKTGYRYYTPEQLSILDAILLCINLDIPLNMLNEFKDEEGYILNEKLYETGKIVAEKKIEQIKTELDKIEYTLRYFNVNKEYLKKKGFYTRPIIERTFAVCDYFGDMNDIKKLEKESAVLYSKAQSSHLSPVFPAGLIFLPKGKKVHTKIFFEVVGKSCSAAPDVITIPEGDFLCKQINLTPETDLINVLDSTFGLRDNNEIIVSNMLLNKFQIGPKKTELQIRAN